VKNIFTIFALIASILIGYGTLPAPSINDSQIILGKSTLSDLVTLVGQLRFTSDAVRNGEKVKIVGNVYEQAFAGSSVSGVFAMNRTMYVLYRDTVVAKHYSSTFTSDTTTFDRAMARSITVGTLKQQLISMLGAASDEGVFPIAKIKGHQVLIYDFRYSRGGAAGNYRRIATFDLDEGDRVSDINIEEAGAENR
jgi:hypothetical protein